jgi:hypothetical protein
VTLADQWYASAAFADTVALIAVAVIAMAVGAKAAIYAGFPKRRLYFSMPVIAPLLSAPEGIRGDLELRHKEISLDDPHLLEVKLISKSRRDIARVIARLPVCTKSCHCGTGSLSSYSLSVIANRATS